jgi:hypothetical protein
VQPRGDRPTWPRDAALDRTELAEPRLDRARGALFRRAVAVSQSQHSIYLYRGRRCR